MRKTTRFSKLSSAIALLPLFAAATTARAATSIVTVGGSGLVFDPNVLTIAPGDNVVFVNAGGFHNVVADDGSFRCAHGCDKDGGNGAASNSQWVVNLTFPTPGTYGYYCETHGTPGSGMFGTIIVQPAVVQDGGGTSTVPAMSAFLGGVLVFAIVLVAAFFRERRR
ncbi:MAG TPA: plastocyanin/azurin family copper-binding protein [Rudaea sp.]